MGEIASMTFTPLQIIQLLVLLIALVYFYVSLVVLVATFARTQKEAGTYVTPLYIIVMLGGVLTMFSSGSERGLEFYAIPVYNAAISLQNLLVGELTMPQFGVAVGSLAILASLITVLITRAFNNEKVMFNA